MMLLKEWQRFTVLCPLKTTEVSQPTSQDRNRKRGCRTSTLLRADIYLLFFFLISHQFYTHQCIHVNLNCPIQHTTIPMTFIFYIVFIYLFIYLFIFGWVGSSSLLRAGFLQLWRAGATLHCGAWASHCGGFSCCGAQAPGARAQQLWRVGSVVVARGLQSAGSAVVEHRLSCSVACGIFPHQGSNPCPLHWQADS